MIARLEPILSRSSKAFFGMKSLILMYKSIFMKYVNGIIIKLLRNYFFIVFDIFLHLKILLKSTDGVYFY